jgi:hypothetical protein
MSLDRKEMGALILSGIDKCKIKVLSAELRKSNMM